MFKIDVGYASRSELSEILDRTTKEHGVESNVIVEADYILRVQELIRRVIIAPHIQDYVTRLVLATHVGSPHAPEWLKDDVVVGASPRGAQAIVSSAKVAAVVDGRFAVSRHDIEAVAVPALQHRIVRTFEA